MMTRWRIGFWTLILLTGLTGAARAGGAEGVTGRVLTADGQPAAGAIIGTHWQFELGSPKALIIERVVADADGRFALDTKFYFGRPRPVLALSADEQTGGLLVITPEQAKSPVEIKLGPLIRVHGSIASEGDNYPLKLATTLVMMKDKNNTSIVTSQSFRMTDSGRFEKPNLAPPSCDFRLPAGDYLLNFIEPTQPRNHTGVAAYLTVKADQPNLDRELKPIKLPLSPLAKQAHKAPPALAIKAARGVPGDVKLADFKGKWVILEFWTTTCGPCIMRGLPEMMNLVDDYPESRDKFVVLAVHGPGADDFADLDKKLVPIVRDVWNGRELPFPILLDDDNKTFEAFGVQGIPTTVVINPEGKVELSGIEAMLEAFPTPPVAVQVARALDRRIMCGLLAGSGAGNPLGETLETLGMGHEFEIKTDPDALKAAGVTAATRVPISLVGPVTLRTALKLVLEPLKLAAVPGPDGLIVTTPPPTPTPTPTAAWTTFQTRSAERLQRRLGETFALQYAAKPLGDVLDGISQQLNEAIVLDPIARKAGSIDPKSPVTVARDDALLGDALKAILGPLGLEAIPRDEVIIVQRKP